MFGNQGMSSAMRAAVQQHHYSAVMANVQRSRIITPPPRSVLADVVEELAKAPPTIEELDLLREVAREADEHDLAPEQIEERLKDTRLWRLLRVLARNDVRVIAYVTILLMIYQTYLMIRPPDAKPAPPPPAPQVTVVVSVPDEVVDKIVDQIERRLEEAGACDSPGAETDRGSAGARGGDPAPATEFVAD
jgi:hypothetical protein